MTAITDIRTALSERLFPTVALWNRLEGRPRTTEFDRAMRAEVRDPLWMLARQLQFGEFRGEDAGSPVTATCHLISATPTRYRSQDSAPVAAPARLPLEAVAEGRPVPFTIGPDQISFDLRVAMGRHWTKLLSSSSLAGKFLARWPIRLPDPAADADAPLVAHPDVWATMQAFAGRVMDGYELYAHIKAGGHSYDGLSGLSSSQKSDLDKLAPKFVAWFEDLIAQPAGPPSFDPARLEHRFALGLPGDVVLAAAEYPGGGLDWYGFSGGRPSLGATEAPTAVTRVVIPGPVRYPGMPNPRWWTFEDGNVDVGAITPASTDLVRLMLMEFALVYGGDWMTMPCDVADGALSRIDGLMITDDFGQRFWIEPAGSGPGDTWQKWSMFAVDGVPGLYVPATAAAPLEGPAVEDALLVRDENANMVWGIERTVWTANGTPLPGSEAARETLAFRDRLQPAPEPDVPIASVAYQAMTTVPENWIPFIPAHVPGDIRQIQLQRGAMPRVTTGGPVDPPVKVRPCTTLLRPGLDTTPAQRYVVHEEEVPKAGTRLSLAFKRARWYDGRVVVWLGVQRSTGRGEAESGLDWDVLADTPAAS